MAMVVATLACARQPASAHPHAQAAAPTPLAPSGTQVHLPALGPITADPACRTWIDVQLAGREPSKAVLVVWGAPEACGGPAGPLRVECSGLMGPGGGWVFGAPDAAVPAGARSGTLFSFNVHDVGEVHDLGGIALCDTVADLMCEELFFGVIGDAAEYARFKQQFDTGGVYRGLPQHRTAGGPLAAVVRRSCPDPSGAGDLATALAGIPGGATAYPGAAPGGPFAYGLPHVVAAGASRSSQVHVQNAGASCAEVDVWFRPAEAGGAADCATPPRRCTPVAVAAGEAARIDVARACGITGLTGSLVLASAVPLAVAVDTLTEGLTSDGTAHPPQPALDAPLAIDRDGGWRARVHVFNHADVAATAVATLWDAAGARLAARDLPLCPRGAAAWEVDVPAGSGPFLGRVSVDASMVPTVDGPVAPGLTGFVALEGPPVTGGARRAAVGHHALAPRVVPNAPGTAAGAAAPPAGAVFVPSLVKARSGGGKDHADTSTLVVANTVQAAGTTDVAVIVLDDNGVLDHRCLTLGAGTVAAVDLRGWAGVPDGFAGSGVVSATAWRHPVLEPDGQPGNRVGLAALALRTDRALGAGSTTRTLAIEGAGAAPDQITGAGYWPMFIPGCPGAPRLVTATPRPWPTPTPSPTATAPPPTPVWAARLWLPRVATVRVRR